MNRTILKVLAAGIFTSSAPASADDALTQKSMAELRRDLDEGRTTSVALVEALLARIEAIDRNGPALHSVLAINPQALQQARERDQERKQRKVRGPLHGIPILIKDNIESADPLPTTAGSLALTENVTGRDAPIVANLRAAGAIVLGKTNLSEWANFRSDHSVSGWSAVGGLTRNPHVLDRTACGSSSGSGAAVAAELAPAAVGTETDGSIVCPAAMNGIVGLKPTLGLLSGKRIVPIARSQDTAGPMTRTVTDAALLLSAMVGQRPVCVELGCAKVDYAGLLPSASLAGKRIGVMNFKPGRWPRIDPIYEQALTHLRAAGATLVEVKTPDTARVDEAEETVLYVEFKSDLNAYLESTPASVKARSLEQLIAFNRSEPRELAIFGQEIFERSNGTAGLSDEKYRTALADSKRLAGVEGLGRLLTENKLDLLVAPTTGPAWRIDLVNGDHYGGSFSTLPAVSGYPHLTVPMGQLNGLPVNISFIGAQWSEAQLLAAGFVFEQRSKALVRPRFVPTVDTVPEEK